MAKLAKPINLLHHSIATEYRKYRNRIPERYRASDREDLRKIVKTICKHIGEQIVEREGGVHIRNFGYFFVWKIPRKMSYNIPIKGGKLEERYNSHTGHHMYSPIFLPALGGRKELDDWSMDNSFHNLIRKGIYNNIRAGKQYRMYAYSLMKQNRKL